jgi:hypothetical protein
MACLNTHLTYSGPAETTPGVHQGAKDASPSGRSADQMHLRIDESGQSCHVCAAMLGTGIISLVTGPYIV